MRREKPSQMEIAKMAKKPKYKRHDIELPNSGKIALYASPKHSVAIEAIKEMAAFEGIKMLDLMDAFYQQGLKHGRKEVVEQFEQSQQMIISTLNYLPPGQPKKKKKH